MKHKMKSGSAEDNSATTLMSSGLRMSNRLKDFSAKKMIEVLSNSNMISLQTPPLIIQQLILKHFGIKVTEGQILKVKEEQYAIDLIEEQKRRVYE